MLLQGIAPRDELEEQQRKLSLMGAALERTKNEYESISSQASNVLSAIGGAVAGAVSGSRTESVDNDGADAAAKAGGGQGGPISEDDIWGMEAAAGGVQGAFARGASNMVYAGLKFSSLAMRVAGDLASSVKDDAERMLKVGGRDMRQPKCLHTCFLYSYVCP